MSRLWAGHVPETCAFCKTSIPHLGVFIDGLTAFFNWAVMCQSCHNAHGGRLGRDFGQKYVLDASTGNWVKARGKQKEE